MGDYHDAAWEDAEAWWEAEVQRRVARIEALVVVDLAERVVRARRNACEVAEAELVAAMERLRRARNEMDDATSVLEMAIKGAA